MCDPELLEKEGPAFQSGGQKEARRSRASRLLLGRHNLGSPAMTHGRMQAMQEVHLIIMRPDGARTPGVLVLGPDGAMTGPRVSQTSAG